MTLQFEFKIKYNMIFFFQNKKRVRNIFYKCNLLNVNILFFVKKYFYFNIFCNNFYTYFLSFNVINLKMMSD